MKSTRVLSGAQNGATQQPPVVSWRRAGAWVAVGSGTGVGGRGVAAAGPAWDGLASGAAKLGAGEGKAGLTKGPPPGSVAEHADMKIKASQPAINAVAL